jgi:antitoxin (DNA-binding transcriptional repressor) of toxin-antitoxin stability system
MIKVNMHEAKTHLSRYAQMVKRGERVILCERNVPFAEIRALSDAEDLPRERPLGLDAGKVVLSDDWDSAATNKEVAGLFGFDA